MYTYIEGEYTVIQSCTNKQKKICPIISEFYLFVMSCYYFEK